MSLFPPRPPVPNTIQIAQYIDLAVAVAEEAASAGKHPFGAVLLNERGEVLMRQGNESTVRHAEAELARRAAEAFAPSELWKCTLVTNFEPCCMCAGAIYWANIGRLLYALPESTLLALTGNHPENPTLALPCRQVFASGSKDVQVIGPVALDDVEMEERVLRSHRGFWEGRD